MAKKDPRQDAFWRDENQKLAETVSEMLIKLMLDGGTEAEDMLPPDMRVLIDWDAFNERVIDWVGKYKLDWLYGINDATRKQVTKAISEWLQSGERLPALEAKLAPVFGEKRAGRIAVTEVTRAYADGNQAAWEATGMVRGRRWNTGRDEKVCPICGGLDQQVSPFGYPFVHPDTREVYDNPPAHVNCRCYTSPVLESDDDFADMLIQGLG